MAGNDYQGEMDSDLAALLGTGLDDSLPPDFNDIFNDNKNAAAAKGAAGKSDEVDLTAGGFPPITKRFEDKPHAFFNDPNYYKTAFPTKAI